MSNFMGSFAVNSSSALWSSDQSLTTNAYSKRLNVPFYVQPTNNTCQSTCLKMYAKYLESTLGLSDTGAVKDILDIWKEINTGTDRPVQYRNHFTNMSWWLEKYFAPLKFFMKITKSASTATELIVQSIDRGFPLIGSTTHSRSSGHIIMIIGYKNYSQAKKDYDHVEFICHDPYGKFNTSLNSELYGKNRYQGGMSLINGTHSGPGMGVTYNSSSIKRMRSDKAGYLNYRLLTAKL